MHFVDFIWTVAKSRKKKRRSKIQKNLATLMDQILAINDREEKKFYCIVVNWGKFFNKRN